MSRSLHFLGLILIFLMGYILSVSVNQKRPPSNDLSDHQILMGLLRSGVPPQNKEEPSQLISMYQPATSHDVALRRVMDIPFTSSKPTEWVPPQLPERLKYVDQSDPDLIAEIRRHWIIPPDNEELNLTQPTQTYFAQANQDKWLDDYFQNKTDGFFAECGAFDGEKLSNTLYFERERGWQGVLIEANPINFQHIVRKHRNAFVVNACLSPSTKAETLNFTSISSHPYLSRLQKVFKQTERAIDAYVGPTKVVESHLIQCFPFYSILLALGNPPVDFFSLDVEGSQKHVMKAIPLDDVNINAFVIEIGKGEKYRTKKTNFYEVLMEEVGYRASDIDGNDIDVAMIKH